MKKRLFSMIFAIMMIVGMMPATALAGEVNYVAQIGNVQYTSIQEAVNAANNGDTITVTASHNLDCTQITDEALISINGNKAVTIDLNGYTVTADYSEAADPYNTLPKVTKAIVYVQTGSKLTMKDSSAAGTGTLHAVTTEDRRKVKNLFLAEAGDENNSDAIQDGVVAEPENSNYSLVFDGGNYKLDYSVDDGSGVLIYSGPNDAIILVRGGNFWLGNIGVSPTQPNGYPWIFNAKYSDANRIIVTGGTFNADVNHQNYEYEVFVPNTKALRANSDGETWTVVDAAAYVDEHHENHSYSHYTRTVGYATLEEAVNAVNTYVDKVNDSAPEHITLVDDCQIKDTLHFTKHTKIDLKGNKIIWAGDDSKPVISFDEGIDVSIDDNDVGKFKPVKPGYTFEDWYTDASYQTKWEPGKSNALYAKWEVIPAVAPDVTEHGYGDTSQAGHEVYVTLEEDSDYTYSYQWYSSTGSNTGGTPIDGATADKYQLPSDAAVGIYNFYCVVTADRVDNDESASTTSDVITVHLYKAPAANENLIYDGTEKELVKAGEVADGKKIEYAVVSGTSDSEVPVTGWSKDVPEAAEAGDYTVYYRVGDDSLFSDFTVGSVKVTIEEPEVPAAADTAKDDSAGTGDGSNMMPVFAALLLAVAAMAVAGRAGRRHE